MANQTYIHAHMLKIAQMEFYTRLLAPFPPRFTAPTAATYACVDFNAQFSQLFPQLLMTITKRRALQLQLLCLYDCAAVYFFVYMHIY